LIRFCCLTQNTHFVDFKKVHFKAGNGGDGCISFLHLFNNPMAGPDGGDGGNGGHIILKANKQVKSLANVQSNYRGNEGDHGTSKDMIGSSGDHLEIEVPVGTLVKSENGELLVDLDTDGGKYIAARGGAGGKGNHFFLSNENRHPRVAQRGAKGEEKVLNLELKTMAHAGLIGFPNVGKSSLLRAISRARPKVANYPFTTVNPYVGIIEYDDYTQISVADLPGLIKDAHKNRGLGISFLKHVERCVCLMYVIDISLKNSWEQLKDLKHELEQFKKGLSKRPHAIVANKYDSDLAEDNLTELKKYILENTPKDEVSLPVIPISAKYGNNIKEFLTHLRALYDLYNRPEPDEEGFSW